MILLYIGILIGLFYLMSYLIEKSFYTIEDLREAYKELKQTEQTLTDRKI